MPSLSPFGSVPTSDAARQDPECLGDICARTFQAQDHPHPVPFPHDTLHSLYRPWNSFKNKH